MYEIDKEGKKELYRIHKENNASIRDISRGIAWPKNHLCNTGFEKYLKKQIRRYGYLG